MTIELPQFIKESWIGKFVKYASPIPTPDQYKLWAGIACMMGTLERRVWVYSAGGELYASHYILLVAPPGVGKSKIIKEVKKFWIATNLLKVAPDSATRAAMVDELIASQRHFDYNGERIIFHSLQVAATEFGVLIPAYDHQAMNFYNLIWDCEDTHKERLRHGEHKTIDIDYPQINMLAGTQPAYLGALLPPDAFGMGFTARLFMIYQGEPTRPTLFGDSATLDENLRKEMIKDIAQIVKMKGEMKFSKEAMAFIEEWYYRNDDAPDHPRLEVYNIRRAMTLQKVCMGIAAGCQSMEITFPMAEFALAAIRDVEKDMPEIFKGMSVPDTSNVMAELFNFTITRWLKTDKKPVSEHMLIDFLKSRVEIHKIDPIMKHMVTSGMLKEAPNVSEPGKFEIFSKRYIPIPKGQA